MRERRMSPKRKHKPKIRGRRKKKPKKGGISERLEQCDTHDGCALLDFGKDNVRWDEDNQA